MLSSRHVVDQNDTGLEILKAHSVKTDITNDQQDLKQAASLKCGLRVSKIQPNTLASKSKPLQPSTNTIHAQQQQRIHLAGIRQSSKPKTTAPTAKKIQPTNTNDIKEQTKKVDENDVSQFIKDPYDPLSEVHPMDEELYHKVLKLELADDGLPTFDSSEPFDFDFYCASA